MATSKPDILIILLQKLMEEGNVMYKVSGFVCFCAAAAAAAAAADLGPPLHLVLDAVATQGSNFVRMGVPKHSSVTSCLDAC